MSEASFFTNRCLRSIMVKQTLVPCKLAIGHEGDCEPIAFPEQSVSGETSTAAVAARKRADRLLVINTAVGPFSGDAGRESAKWWMTHSQAVARDVLALVATVERLEGERDAAERMASVRLLQVEDSTSLWRAVEARVESAEAENARLREALEQLADERPALDIGSLGRAYVERTRAIASAVLAASEADPADGGPGYYGDPRDTSEEANDGE